MTVQSELVTLQQIKQSRLRFIVPIYQRLYVWGQDQIRILLEDLMDAYVKDEELFYLGGTLVMERRDGSLELIDGQQRFTTLWLISLALKEEGDISAFLSVRHNKNEISRLVFAIREGVQKLFDRLRESGIKAASESEDKNAVDEADNIKNALQTIHSFFLEVKSENKDINLVGFADYIFYKVKLVLTRVPAHTDLNKLFEVINNRGVQLQQHEMLKAKMLALLPENERWNYGRLWDACAGMGDYVERNLRTLIDKEFDIRKYFDNTAAKNDIEKLRSPKEVIRLLQKDNSSPSQSLAEIIADVEAIESTVTEDESGGKQVRDESGVRSIVGFPLFLEHVLRIWRFRNKESDIEQIADKQLLSLFETYFLPQASADSVRGFISLLWEIRYLFDKYVIKWVMQGEDEHHLIQPLVQSNDDVLTLSRDEEPASRRSFSLLQSMLYHSQPIAKVFWLTPLLNFLYSAKGDIDRAERFLRHMDNHWFCSKDERTMIERSWGFMINPWEKGNPSCDIMDEHHGLSFPHYWFYKLEFVLWDINNKSIMKEIADRKQVISNFRITARNSVEHISPQMRRKKDDNQVPDEYIDCFGNLALVSRGVNSEYSNMSFIAKQGKFIENNYSRNSKRVDSLKMALIYANKEWGKDYVIRHNEQMKKIMSDYINKDFSK